MSAVLRKQGSDGERSESSENTCRLVASRSQESVGSRLRLRVGRRRTRRRKRLPTRSREDGGSIRRRPKEPRTEGTPVVSGWLASAYYGGTLRARLFGQFPNRRLISNPFLNGAVWCRRAGPSDLIWYAGRVSALHRRWLVLILAVALALRVGWAVAQPRSAAAIDRLPDQREYLTLAEGLRHHGSLELFDARFGRTVIAYRLPGYPAFVAACGGSVLVVRLAQAAVDTVTVLATFLLARQLSGSLPGGLRPRQPWRVNPIYSLLFRAAADRDGLHRGRRLGHGRGVPPGECRRRSPASPPPCTCDRPRWCSPRSSLHSVRTGGATGRTTGAIHPHGVSACLFVYACAVGRAGTRSRLRAAVWTTTNDGITLLRRLPRRGHRRQRPAICGRVTGPAVDD